MFLSLSCTLLWPIWKWFSPHSPQCHTNCWHPFKRQTFIINLLFSLRACGCAPAFVLTLDVSVRQQLFYKKIQGSMENKNLEQGRWWKFCLLKCSGVYRLVGARGIQLWSFLIGCFHSPSIHKCLSNVLFFNWMLKSTWMVPSIVRWMFRAIFLFARAPLLATAETLTQASITILQR